MNYEKYYRIRRKVINQFVILLSTLIALMGLLLPFWILFTVINRGISSFDLSLFTDITPPPGSDGGLHNAIIGSLLMVGMAMLLATPIGVMAGVFLAEYSRDGKLATIVRFVNDILLSAPSIVIGLFVYTIMVLPMGHFSAWAGVISLAIIAVPIIVRTTENMLLLVPDILRHGSLALGSSRRQVILKIALPAARNGIITGILLALARISGETAPLLFTALNNQFDSSNLNHPIANLPVVIFQYAMSPYAGWQSLAWAGSALIVIYVLVLNLLARAVFSRRML